MTVSFWKYKNQSKIKNVYMECHVYVHGLYELNHAKGLGWLINIHCLALLLVGVERSAN